MFPGRASRLIRRMDESCEKTNVFWNRFFTANTTIINTLSTKQTLARLIRRIRKDHSTSSHSEQAVKVDSVYNKRFPVEFTRSTSISSRIKPNESLCRCAGSLFQSVLSDAHSAKRRTDVQSASVDRHSVSKSFRQAVMKCRFVQNRTLY